MPNIKSASKRVELSRAAEAANTAKKSALKTTIKKFDAAVVAGNKEEAAAAYKVAVKAIDKAAVSGLKVGNYTVKVTYSGDEKYLGDRRTSLRFAYKCHRLFPQG